MPVPLFKISSDPTISALVQDGIDTMILELGKDCKIVVEGDKAQCPNCLFDSSAEKSAGVYNGTGPRTFTRPPCPICGGTGYDPTTSEAVIIKKFSIRRNVRPSEVLVPGQITKAITIARIKGYVTDIPSLANMKYIILDYLNEKYTTERYVKLTDPSPTGNLVAGRYFIMYLQKVQ
jgi:hypothetical protein